MLSQIIKAEHREQFLAEATRRRIGWVEVEDHAPAWAACERDAAHFIDTYVVIDEPHGDDVATVPFKLWPAQIEALAKLVVAKLVIFLKARQIGITWLACGYGLWLCLTRPGRVVMCFSKSEDDAEELIRRFSVMYQRLPGWMRELRPLVVDNTADLEWSNGSRVAARAATKGAGRSFTCSLAILDEFAFMQYGQEVYTALKPTVDGGGQLFIVSTANGEGNLYHRMWANAVKGINNFLPLFLSWRARPDRTAEWRAKVASEAITSALDKAEYPETAEDAFQNTGGEPYLPSIDLWTRLKEELPALSPNEPMVLAADGATGRQAGPSDCFGLVGVTPHPRDPSRTADRYVKKWQAAKGQQIDFEGTDEDPGPLREIRRLHRDYNVLQLAYDPTELRYAASVLELEGIWCQEFSQGNDMVEADKALLDAIIQRAHATAGDEDLTEHLQNADRQVNPQDKRLRMVKRVESKKIDLAKSLSMARARIRELVPG